MTAQERDNQEPAIKGPNHTLLCGTIAASLMAHGIIASPEIDEDGNYTNRIMVMRSSGAWVLTVEPLEVEEL